MHRPGKSLVLLAVVCGLFVAPTGAAAATIFGSNLLGEINWEACAGETETWSCTFANPDLPEASQALGGAAAPSAGVLTSWRVKAGDSGAGTLERKLRLRVLRGYTGVGTGSLESLPLAAGIYNYATRLPVQAGDRLGLDFPDAAGGEPVPVISAAPGVPLDYWNPLLGEGVETLPNSPQPSQELLVQATLEPDVDGDGLGDETQDKCPGKAGQKEGCPEPSDPSFVCPPSTAGCGPLLPLPRPDTKLGKGGPKGKTDKTKATFGFTATVKDSTFQCKLDKKPWKPCKSPRTYRNLKEGRHKFRVRAVAPGSAVDATPARRSFKVES
jgi:hypothetical protein